MRLKFLCGLSLLLLPSCASKQPDFAPLPPVTRIEVATRSPKRPYAAVKKTLTDAGHIARVVAAVDAEKSGWQTVPDGLQGDGLAIDLTFYSSSGALRQFIVHHGVISGNLGNTWNLSALDMSRGVGAGSGAQRVVKLAPDAQIEALRTAIGPLLPPKPKSNPPKSKK